MSHPSPLQWFVSPEWNPTDGDTLLHIAIRLQREDLMRWLQERGVDPDKHANKKNQSPYAAALELGGPHLLLYNRVFGLSAITEQQAKDIYDKALAEGQAPLNRCKLMIFGQGGAGKTSLRRALCKDGFDEDEASTEVVDISSIVISPGKEWCKASQGSGLFREQIAYFLSEGFKETTDGKQVSSFSELPPAMPSAPNPQASSSSIDMSAPQNSLPPDLQPVVIQEEEEEEEEEDDDLDLNDEEALNHIREQALALETAGTQRKILLNVWDFGGQALYYALHHVFIRTTAIFLVVFNLHDALNDPLQTSKHLLHWVNSIHTYSIRRPHPFNRISSPDSPPPDEEETIFLVGTHKDQLPQGQMEQALTEIDDMLFRVFKGLDCYCRLRFPSDKDGTRIFFAISNKASNEGQDDGEMGALREAIFNAVQSMTFIHKPRPLRWIRINDALRLWRRKEEVDQLLGVPGEVITYGEARKVANIICQRVTKSTGIKRWAGEEELRLMLRFLHDIGELIYFEGLMPSAKRDDNIIVLAYTWLVRMLRRILIRNDPKRDKKMPSEYKRQRPDKTQADWAAMWEDLSLQGVLHQDLLLFRLWEGVPEATSAVTLRLLDKLDLMCAMPQDERQDQICYLIPSIPLYYATDRRGALQQGGTSEATPGPALAIFMFAGFLPEGLFSRLLVQGVRQHVWKILSVGFQTSAMVIKLATGARVSVQLTADPQAACIRFHRPQHTVARPSSLDEAAQAALETHDLLLDTCKAWYGKAMVSLKVWSTEDPDHLFDVHEDIFAHVDENCIPNEERPLLISSTGAEVSSDQFLPWVTAYILRNKAAVSRATLDSAESSAHLLSEIISSGDIDTGASSDTLTAEDVSVDNMSSSSTASLLPKDCLFQGVKYLLASAVPKEPFENLGVVQVHFTKRVGGGSFGNVYACSMADINLDSLSPGLKQKLRPFCTGKRAACVKLLHALSDPDWRELSLRDYERELVAHSSFEHPRIVQYLGEVPRQVHPFLGETCGIVMEQADSTLKDHMRLLRERPGGVFTVPEAGWRHIIQLAQDIAEGLQALHEHPLKIVHRDVHEENILVLRGRALIGDFGRGKALQRYGSHIHTREPGMLLIVPPEASGLTDSYDCSYDIFGMGFILAKLALCASLSEEEWQSQQRRLGKGPLAEDSFWRQSRTRQDELVKDWQAWLMRLAEQLCKQTGHRSYWGLILDCCEKNPQDRPKAAQVVASLAAMHTSSSSS